MKHGTLVVASLLVLALAAGVSAQTGFLTIGSGGTTGVYFPIAVGIAKMINDADIGVRSNARSTGGSVFIDFSEMPRATLPSVAIWEHYLVYAVPLGVADRVIRQLRDLYPAAATRWAPWPGSPRRCPPPPPQRPLPAAAVMASPAVAGAEAAGREVPQAR